MPIRFFLFCFVLRSVPHFRNECSTFQKSVFLSWSIPLSWPRLGKVKIPDSCEILSVYFHWNSCVHSSKIHMGRRPLIAYVTVYPQRQRLWHNRAWSAGRYQEDKVVHSYLYPWSLKQIMQKLTWITESYSLMSQMAWFWRGRHSLYEYEHHNFPDHFYRSQIYFHEKAREWDRR